MTGARGIVSGIVVCWFAAGEELLIKGTATVVLLLGIATEIDELLLSGVDMAELVIDGNKGVGETETDGTTGATGLEADGIVACGFSVVAGCWLVVDSPPVPVQFSLYQ